MNRWIILVLLALDSDLIAAGVISVILFNLKNQTEDPIAKKLLAWMSFFFICVAFRGICELCAFACGFIKEPVYTTGFVWFYLVGRAAKTCSIWLFLIYLLSFNRKK